MERNSSVGFKKKIQLYKTSDIYKYEYDKKDNLYKKAIKAKEIFKKIEYLEKAANENHSLAMIALYELYSDIDDEIALK